MYSRELSPSLRLSDDLNFNFSTGYENIRDTIREIFGDETMDKTSLVWGLDEEGELRGSYRPTGHPGVSFRVTLEISHAEISATTN